MAKRATPKNTRKKRSAVNKSTVQPVSKTTNDFVAPSKLPSIAALAGQAVTIIKKHAVVLFGIASVYALAMIIFSGSVIDPATVSQVRNQFENRIVGSTVAYVQVVGVSSSGTNAVTGAYQAMFLVLTSLALIWALRQLLDGQTIKIRDAWYNGMSQLIPFLLLAALLVVQLLPLTLGWLAYAIVISNGLATAPLAMILWFFGAVGLSFVSLYFASATIMSLYAVTLPGVKPWQTYRATRNLVKHKRWAVLCKLLALPLILLVLCAVIMVPIIFIVPFFAPVILIMLGATCVVVAHSYCFILYRSLLG